MQPFTSWSSVIVTTVEHAGSWVRGYGEQAAHRDIKNNAFCAREKILDIKQKRS